VSENLHDVHRLHHALGQIVVDAVDDRAALEAELAAIAPGDMIQQLQLDISGQATSTPAVLDFEVSWPNPFLNDVAPGDVDGNLDNPSFAPGIEMQSDGAVMAQVQVRRWIRDESSLIVGALLRAITWTAYSPEVPPPAPSPFRAVLHLTFIGYAVPADEDDDDDQEADP
jgi:hypothetical protein